MNQIFSCPIYPLIQDFQLPNLPTQNFQSPNLVTKYSGKQLKIGQQMKFFGHYINGGN
jgi:hypothetical protein